MYDDSMHEATQDIEDGLKGHKIVDATQVGDGAVIVLDNGTELRLVGLSDCCAYAEVSGIVLNLANVDNIITDVVSEDGYEKLVVMACMEEVLSIDVSWSGGSGYYAYGFEVHVEKI